MIGVAGYGESQACAGTVMRSWPSRLVAAGRRVDAGVGGKRRSRKGSPENEQHLLEPTYPAHLFTSAPE